MITEEFKKEFAEFVKKFENEKLKIYDCGDGVPTIGIGFTLINKVQDRWNACDREFLKSRGINLTDDQYEIIKNYAKAKYEGVSTLHLKKQLESLDFTIDIKISQSLLEYSIEQKYKEFKNQIGGEEHWDKLNLAQQVGLMDHAFQRGNILPLKESLIAGNYDKTAEIMREIPNNSKSIKDRAELRADLVKYGTMKFSGIHVVQPNDIASDIAKHHNITLKQLTEWNPHLKNLNELSVGQKINIASPIERDGAIAIATSSNNVENISINESNSQRTTISAEHLREMLVLLALTEHKKQLENQQKLEKLAEKVKTSLTEYESKVNEILKDFVNKKGKNLSDNETSFVNQANAEIQQIAASIETKNASLFAQKQAELDVETQAKFAAARATPTYSSIPTTVTVSNADIAARKQAEYHSLMDGYKAQCETQIAAIKARYETQANKRKQSVEFEISNKVDIIKQQSEAYNKELISKFEEVKAKLTQGEDVDVDNVMNNIDIRISANLENIQNIISHSTTTAYPIIGIVYDNPVLNHPKLIEQIIAQKNSPKIINKLIDFGMQCINNLEGIAMLESVFNELNNVDTMVSLVGSNISDSTT
ncbi:LysM peptidoglycan-binding domain-containing protein [Candidatus Tisiphia endosymbiont of Temnostethus pusillus]|uniref:LysM peptidoglycan-binding domain-containing protein n=1 Tax=Candidatus Tisiphia endosymbiont of Temnostethus pusillus TaxID=3139335 RepID=UPI0035C8C3CB